LLRAMVFILLLLVICAGIARLTSTVLLGFGMEGMGVRYAVGTLSAYLVLIVGLVAVARLNTRADGAAERQASEVSASWKRRESGFDKTDVFNAFDVLTDGAFVWAAIAAALALAYLVSGAAGAIAEIAVDVAVAGMAVRQVRRSLGDDFGTVIRRTMIAALVLALAVAVVGALLQSTHPGAVSLTDILTGNYEPR
jgi:hypothetical protein